MTLEPVLVPALLLTHLTVPTKLLEALGLHAIGQVLDGALLGPRHLGPVETLRVERKTSHEAGTGPEPLAFD